MELVVFKPAFATRSNVGVGSQTAEVDDAPKPDVVEQNDHDVGRTGRRWTISGRDGVESATDGASARH